MKLLNSHGRALPVAPSWISMNWQKAWLGVDMTSGSQSRKSVKGIHIALGLERGKEEVDKKTLAAVGL